MEHKSILELLEVYHSLPALWDVKSDSYRNKVIKNQQYETLLEKYKEAHPKAGLIELKKKINSLRTCYKRELKRLRDCEKSGSAGTDCAETTLYYFDAMRFLDDCDTTISSTSSSAQKCIKSPPTFCAPSEDFLANVKQKNLSDKCRTCGETTQNTNAKKLFDVEQKELIREVELLTGEWLYYESDLPSYICICCEQDLIVAAAFRKRCIQTQKILRHQQIIAAAKPDYMDPLNNVSDRDAQTDEEELAQLLVEEDDSTLGVDDDIKITETTQLNNAKENYMQRQQQQQQQMLKILPKPRVPTKVHRCKKRKINWSGLTEEQARELKRTQRLGNFVCDQCGRHFNDQCNFKLHLLRHTGVKDYECKTCNQKFYTPYYLKRHERMHSGIGLHHCQYCDKTFNYKMSKDDHERVHLDERPFECDECGKTFRSTGRLRKHKKTHIGIRKYHCEVCDKWFLMSSTLNAHYKSQAHKSRLLIS